MQLRKPSKILILALVFLATLLLCVGIFSQTKTNDAYQLGWISRPLTRGFALNQNLRMTDSPTFAGLTLSAPLTPANGGTGDAVYPIEYLPDGSIIVGGEVAVPVGSLTGVSISATTANTTTLTKASHGLTGLIQGYIIAITNCTTAVNKGIYTYVSSTANTLEIVGVLSGSDSNIALTIYKNIQVIQKDGARKSMVKLTDDKSTDADMISYEVDKSTGTSRGLQVFFGSPTGHWGDGETFHLPFSIYRNLHRESEIFKVDTQGNTYAAGNLTANGGLIKGGNVSAVPITALAAPTITPSAAGSTTWSYVYVVNFADGSHSAASSVGSTTAGPADLTGNYNAIAIPYIDGAYSVDIYRTTAGTTPATTGKIISGYRATLKSTVNTNNYDTGLVGDGLTAPTTNTTGQMAAAGITLTDLAAVTTPAESWIGPSSTTGIYFKGGNVGIGHASPAAPFDIRINQNSPTSVWILNGNTGTAAKAQFLIGQVASAYNYTIFQHWGSGFTTNGLAMADRFGLIGYDTNGLVVGTAGLNGPLIFGTSDTERGRFDLAGNFSLLVVAEYADNAAALAAGLAVGTVYRTGDLMKIVH